MPKLIKSLIAALQAPARGSSFVWDSLLPGFGVRTLASGRSSYVVRYRNDTGTDRMMTLARCADMHPDEARELARDAFRSVREGRDPKTDRTTRRNAPRLEDLRDRFMEDHASQKKPGTARNYEILWRRHVLPILGNPAVADVQEADILNLRRRLKDRPITANRVLELLSVACKLAEKWRWRERGTNPCAFVESFPEVARERILTQAEISRLWSALDAPEIIPSFRALVRLLLLTGRRLDEWREAKWSWVDLDRATLSLPDSKAGAMVHPTPPEAVVILQELPRSSIYVLPGLTGGPLGGHQKMWRRLRASIGLDDVRLHDLRHTAGSYAHAAGLSQREIADLLGHRQMSTAARYIHGIGSDRHEKAAAASEKILGFAIDATRQSYKSDGL
jgi:integrase